MPRISVILVEDDASLREGMAVFLRLSGVEVTAVGSGIEFTRLITLGEFSVAIIDLGLPDVSGQHLVELLRKSTETAVIVLTANNALQSRVESYQLGADLFLEKPVDARELLAAINSLAMRAGERLRKSATAPESPPAQPAGWKVLPSEWTLVSPLGKSIRFTGKEFEFIGLLLAHPGQSVGSAFLKKALYQRDDPSATAALATLVKRVRQRIRRSGVAVQPIMTDHGTGYRFGATILRR